MAEFDPQADVQNGGFITVSSIKFLAGPIKYDTLQRATFVSIRHAREPSARQFPIPQECFACPTISTEPHITGSERMVN